MRLSLVTASLAVLLFSPGLVQAQGWSADLSVGAASDAWRAAVAVPWQLPVGERLVLGIGPRVTYYAGDPARYRNRGRTTIALPSRVTLDPSLAGVNLMVLAEVKLVPRVRAGANLDLAGLAAGPSLQVGAAEFTPARGSLFLYGNADRGSLNSEYYLRVAPAAGWSVRGGFSHYVTGYQGKAGGTTSRYLRFDSVWFLALGRSW